MPAIKVTALPTLDLASHSLPLFQCRIVGTPALPAACFPRCVLQCWHAGAGPCVGPQVAAGLQQVQLPHLPAQGPARSQGLQRALRGASASMDGWSSCISSQHGYTPSSPPVMLCCVDLYLLPAALLTVPTLLPRSAPPSCWRWSGSRTSRPWLAAPPATQGASAVMSC